MLCRAWRTASVRRRSVLSTWNSTRWIQSLNAVREEVSVQEYADRRKRFLECLPDNSVVLLPAADESLYSHDILWPHRQDSLWYHLFGMRISMRRQLAPPCSAITEDVRITMAVFAKGIQGIPTRTLLCVPPVTTDSATLVWRSEAAPLSEYKRLLGADEDAAPSPRTHENVVTTNEVGTVCEEVRRFITEMAQQQIMQWLVHSDHPLTTSPGGGGGGGGGGELGGRLLPLGLIPSVFAAYPQQLRWDGRGYRLRQRSKSLPHTKTRGVARSTSVFHHPLEAFFFTLSATPFVLHLPRPLLCAAAAAAAAPGQQPVCSVVKFSYSAVDGYTPGLAPSTASVLPTQGRVSSTPRGRDPPASLVTSSVSADSESDNTMQIHLPVLRSDAYAWLYRQTKPPSQLRQHLRSARATEDAFLQLMRRATTTLSEHVLHCAFQRAVCDISERAGAAVQVRSAYIPVVASGVRGTEIHFTDNDGVAALGDVVRVDAGVEVDSVPTDCTRTLPIGCSHFSPSYVPLYEGLLQIQRKLLRCMGPGVSISEITRMHIAETQALLCSLGIDVRRTATSSQEQQVPLNLVRSCFCAHLFGHFFGLDIHEELSSASQPHARVAEKEGSARQQRPTSHTLRGGMMHTVEPGVYIPSVQRATLFGLEGTHFPIAFHGGVGMQIEDDVLVLPSPGDEDVDVCSDEESRVYLPWSRGEYLQHALAAFHRYYDGGDAGTTPSLLVSVCDAHVSTVGAGGMTAAARNVLRFLFAQRVSMDGLPKAMASLAADVCTIQQQTFVPNPAYLDGPPVPHAAVSDWYPYSSIVLTATIPKDIELIEVVMQQ
ncbi:Aminopeptidase P [Leishmania braziliensis]|nr:Aminopeptidase P [Leishmania braziliensis]CAJ2482465.1 unnamed protein product [Leishmania braziliensis]